MAPQEVVRGSITMAMPRPQAETAINDPAFQNAITSSIAQTAGVNSSQVNVNLRLARRLLAQGAEALRRLDTAKIQADYTIAIPSGSSVASGSSVLTALSSANIAAFSKLVTDALITTSYSVTVAAIPTPIRVALTTTAMTAQKTTATGAKVETLSACSSASMPLLGVVAGILAAML